MTNKFMIGNYVQPKDKPVMIVVGISSSSVELYMPGSEADPWTVEIEDVEGVPITNDWLAKLGFKYTKIPGLASFDEDRHNPDDVTHTWNISVKRSEYVQSSFEFSLIKWGDDKDFTFSCNNLRLQPRFVHQVQNMFTVLTEIELIVKEIQDKGKKTNNT